MSGGETPVPEPAAPERAADATMLDITMLEVAAAPVPRAPVGPPPSPSLRILSPLERLAREPHSFDFDQAIAVAAHGQDPLALRYRTTARLGYAWGEVTAAQPERGELVLGTFGLIGAGGTMPRHYTATVARENRKRSHALHAFLDMFGGRFAGLHAKAGAKYRPARNPAASDRVLSAAISMATPGLDGRLRLPMSALLYHAGNLSSHSRSAERLRAMLEEEAGGAVTLEEFAGGWIRLPESEQTRMAGGGRGRGATGQHARLGQGAGAGAAIWDPMARFVIRLGPLPRAAFEALLPGTPRHTRLVELARLFVGLDTGFAFNLVLARDEVPAMALGKGARLGWSSWLNTPRPRRRDAAEPIFDARLDTQGTA